LIARSHLQQVADGLDSKLVTVVVDELDDHFCGRSSSAAKKADAPASGSRTNASEPLFVAPATTPSRGSRGAQTVNRRLETTHCRDIVVPLGLSSMRFSRRGAG
jgi:hypothetical protein